MKVLWYHKGQWHIRTQFGDYNPIPITAVEKIRHEHINHGSILRPHEVSIFYNDDISYEEAKAECKEALQAIIEQLQNKP